MSARATHSWCAEYSILKLIAASADRDHGSRNVVSRVSLGKQILSILISCQIQDLLRLCQPTHQPTRRRAYHDTLLGFAARGLPALMLCHVRADSPKSREGRRERDYDYQAVERHPYLHTFIERTRATGGGLQLINHDLMLPIAHAVPNINLYKRRDKLFFSTECFGAQEVDIFF